MCNVSPRSFLGRILWLAGLLLVAAFFTACGGSDDPAQPVTHQPQVSDLTYSPTSAVQAVGGTSTIKGTVKFSDAGGDVVSLRLTTSSGQDLNLPLPQVQGLIAGVVAGEIVVSLDVAGTFSFETWVTDSTGLASNRLRGTFVVVQQTQPPTPPVALTALAVSPSSSTVAKGLTQQFSATGTFSDGTTRDISTAVQWASSDQTIATVDASGFARSLSIGSATIEARSGSVSASAVLTVSSAVLTSITVTPLSNYMSLGDNQPFTASGGFSDGTTQDITQAATWSSSDSAVLLLNNSPGRVGIANTRGTGSAKVIAASGTITGTSAVTVGRREPWVLYAANLATSNIAAFRVSPSTGMLTQLPNSPFATTTGATSIAVARGFERLYSTDFGRDAISGFWIDWDGSLVPLQGSPFAAGSGPVSVVAHPTADIVYVTNQGSGDVMTFAVDTATGALSRKSSVVLGNAPLFSAMTYDGKRLYQSVSAMNQVAGFAVSETDGSLTPIPGGLVSTATFPRAVAIDPAGKFVYVAISSGTTVYGFSIDALSGALAPVPGSPITSLSDAVSLAVDASGRFLFVANRGGTGSLSAFAIDPNSGALTEVAGSPFAVIWPLFAATDPSGLYVYIGGDAGLEAFAMNPLTGALTSLGVFPGNNVWSIAITYW
jgi:6-phosphogluconolactonase (cycloisomerase 2 family)